MHCHTPLCSVAFCARTQSYIQHGSGEQGGGRTGIGSRQHPHSHLLPLSLPLALLTLAVAAVGVYNAWRKILGPDAPPNYTLLELLAARQWCAAGSCLLKVHDELSCADMVTPCRTGATELTCQCGAPQAELPATSTACDCAVSAYQRACRPAAQRNKQATNNKTDRLHPCRHCTCVALSLLVALPALVYLSILARVPWLSHNLPCAALVATLSCAAIFCVGAAPFAASAVLAERNAVYGLGALHQDVVAFLVSRTAGDPTTLGPLASQQVCICMSGPVARKLSGTCLKFGWQR